MPRKLAPLSSNFDWSRLSLWLALALGAVFFCFIFCMSVGAYPLGLDQVLRSLLHGTSPDAVDQIVWELRLPRVCSAALSGAALGVAGAAFQSLLRNPLADPFISGTSAGAGFGAALAIALGLSGWAIPACAFAMALAAVYSVYRLARVGPQMPLQTFLLAGVVVSSFLASLVSVILLFARQDLPRILFWLMGSFNQATWSNLQWLAPLTVVGCLAIYWRSLDLNLLSLGEDQSRLLGLNAETSKHRLIWWASLLTAVTVSAAGLVGFVGLVVPHLARRLAGHDHRALLPLAMGLGACGLMLADTLARSFDQVGDVPVGVVTSLVGAPFFLYLLRRTAARA